MDTLTEQRIDALMPLWQKIERRVAHNFMKTLNAFRNIGLSSSDLLGSSGYGYDDRGRDLLDQIVAQIFGAESALVRNQWVSGTHAIASAVRALVHPGDQIWVASGPLYDTLLPLFFGDLPGSLPNHQIDTVILPVAETTQRPIWPDTGHPRIVYIQRSRGYQDRPTWGQKQIAPVIEKAHSLGALAIVDNCYGEFTDTSEPTEWGADLVIGSLMKNPGGALAPTGGYIAGRKILVDQVADLLFAPGIGREVGPTGGLMRLLAQGWFFAPRIVGEALMGGLYAQRLFQEAGYTVYPQYDDDDRNDIVSAICLNNADAVISFCEAIQAYSPIDVRAIPEPWAMPGYDDPVIMAAGGFVAGGSLELSADAPMRPPFWVYLQGGVNRWHTVFAVDYAMGILKSRGLTQ